MTGKANEMSHRIRLTLPGRWFSDAPPVLEGLLAALGSLWANLYALLEVVKSQTRLATTTGEFLDTASADYFGSLLPRAPNETDQSFLQRVRERMVRERGTRSALLSAVAAAGCTARVFEPARIADTGAYGVAGAIAWGAAGGWGSLSMPLECLITAELSPGADEGTLRAEILDVLPAGGVAWLRIVSS